MREFELGGKNGGNLNCAGEMAGNARWCGF